MARVATARAMAARVVDQAAMVAREADWVALRRGVPTGCASTGASTWLELARLVARMVPGPYTRTRSWRPLPSGPDRPVRVRGPRSCHCLLVPRRSSQMRLLSSSNSSSASRNSTSSLGPAIAAVHRVSHPYLLLWHSINSSIHLDMGPVGLGAQFQHHNGHISVDLIRLGPMVESGLDPVP